MKFYVALVSVFLILAYTAIVGVFYKDRFESDLASKAQSFFSHTEGLENVRVEFRSFDAFLSGEVPSPKHRETAAGFITSLPAARLVSNRIVYPGFDSAPAKISSPDPLSPKNPPPPPSPPPSPPPPPPKTPPSLTISSTGRSLTLAGALPDVTLKSSFLRAIALSGIYPDVQGVALAIDPDLAAADWPERLPDFIAFLLTRTTSAEFTIDGGRVAIAATALDDIALRQIEERLEALDFGDRNRAVDLAPAPPPDIPENSFFFKAVLDGKKLGITGLFPSEKARERLEKILAADLPDLEITEEIAIKEELTAPSWVARLPNLLSLVCSRARDARITATSGTLTLIGEMDRGQSPEDLADIISLMIGADVAFESRLLAFNQGLSEAPPPSDPAPAPAADPATAPEN